MSTYQVKAADIAGKLEANGDRPELHIVHLTLSQNGTDTLAVRFMKPSTPLPQAGETVDYEVTGQDNRSGRVKVKPVSTYASGNSGGGGQNFTPDPERGRRIERQHQTEMALRYIGLKVQLGTVKDFTMDDVAKLTDAFCRDLDGTPAPNEFPFDDTGLPPLDPTKGG